MRLDRIVDCLQRPHFLVNGAVACDDIDLKRLNLLLLWRESDYDEDINFVWHCTWFQIMMVMTKILTLFDDDIVPCPRSVGSDRSCIYSYILDLLTCQRCIAINLSQNTKYTTANTKYTQQIQKTCSQMPNPQPLIPKWWWLLFLELQKQRHNLTFIYSWRVLSAPTGPYQALSEW